MKVSHDADVEWEPFDPAHFTGNGRVKRVSATNQDPSVKVYRVDFEPEARTNWHSHSGFQLLYIVEGRCRVQNWGEDVKEAGPGDIVTRISSLKSQKKLLLTSNINIDAGSSRNIAFRRCKPNG